MVYFVRTAKAQAQRGKEAVEHALKVAGYIQENYDTAVEVLMNVTGQQDELHWLARKESVGEFEKVFVRLMADPGYEELLKEGQEFYVQGTTRDHYFRSVS